MGEIRFTVDENALQVLSSTEIQANFAETKTALEEMVKPYKGVLVDASNVRETKADIARIRKVEKSIDDYRKLVKKYVTAPLTAFEDKCKELKAVCTEAVDAMDVQVKAIEQKQKDEKIAALRKFFDEAEKKYPDYVSFDTICDPSWENKTCPIEKCQNDILEYIGTVERDIDIIKSLNSEDEIALLMRYSETEDLRDVMDYNQSLIRRKKQAAEQATPQAEDAMKENYPDEPAIPFTMPEEEPAIPQKTVQFSFRFRGTPAEISFLEESLLRIGIKNYRMIYE